MKDKIKRLVELEQEAKTIREELEPLVEKIARRVLAVKHGNGFHVKQPVASWEVDADSISFCWEDWYCGDSDRGYGSFPIDLLWDDEALTQWEIGEARRKVEEQEREKQHKVQQEEEFQRAQYERLKAKFEPVDKTPLTT